MSTPSSIAAESAVVDPAAGLASFVKQILSSEPEALLEALPVPLFLLPDYFVPPTDQTEPAPEKILAQLARSLHADVRLAVAHYRYTPVTCLLQLVQASDIETRRVALERLLKEFATADTFQTLASNTYSDVLETVARHPATPAACDDQLARNLGASLLRDYVRTEYRTEQEWVDDTEYDAYGSAYSSSGHYEDRQVSVNTPDYERINQLLVTLPLKLRRAMRAQSGNLQSDSNVHWAL